MHVSLYTLAVIFFGLFVFLLIFVPSTPLSVVLILLLCACVLLSGGAVTGEVAKLREQK